MGMRDPAENSECIRCRCECLNAAALNGGNGDPVLVAKWKAELQKAYVQLAQTEALQAQRAKDRAAAGEKAGGQVFEWEQVLQLGASKSNLMPCPNSWNDIATICYTSGTTGTPKGALMTHGNILADIAGLKCSGIEYMKNARHISSLPLAHMFERTVMS